MNFLRNVGHCALDNFPILVPAVIILVLIVDAITRGPAKYVQAPAEFCTSASTGQVREWESTSTQCMSWAQNGTCSAWMPYTAHHVERQARVTCDWLEWR